MLFRSVLATPVGCWTSNVWLHENLKSLGGGVQGNCQLLSQLQMILCIYDYPDTQMQHQKVESTLHIGRKRQLKEEECCLWICVVWTGTHLESALMPCAGLSFDT